MAKAPTVQVPPAKPAATVQIPPAGGAAAAGAKPMEEPEAPVLPARIRITHLHGFIDEDETHRQWKGGTVVSNPDEIALLIGRGARYEVLEA